MNLSMRWLSDYVKIDVSPKQFSHSMTMTGSKVEGYETEGSGIKNVVVGKVLSVEKHPDADKLVLCSVSVGSGEPLPIVTGAPNLFPGAVVPVALNGAELPGGKTIREGMIRGKESKGMLCSINELGLTGADFPGNDESGIMILDPSLPLGEDITKALHFDDTIVEFEITSNRPDCLSVIGLAREASATFGSPLSVPVPSVQSEEGDISRELSVTVKEPDLCVRYAAKMIKDVKIEPSPQWMRERLRASGVRPINNIVDITNYVMLEYGQPMHAFDSRYVSGNEIIVRCAEPKETITTLDGTVRDLTPDMLVICDQKGPIAVAGVMGGEHSGIMADTSCVVFESACFSGPSIRRTSKKLGLRTESSGRFEKGLDPLNALPALLRACQLVEQLGAGKVVGGIIDVRGAMPKQTEISVDFDWINRFLGTQIDKEQMKSDLGVLGFELDGDLVKVPSWRRDVTHKTDIAEEVARLFGYDRIDSTLISGYASGGLNKKQQFIKKTGETLQSLGLNEVITSSFISPKYYDKILLSPDSSLRDSVCILNSLGEDTSIMRTTALPSMLEVVARNIASRTLNAKFYEIATEYIPQGEGALPLEQKQIVISLYGQDADYFTLKGIIEDLCSNLRIASLDFVPYSSDPSFHPGKTASLKAGDKVIGILGEIHPLVSENYGITQKLYAAKVSLEDLYQHRLPEKKYSSVPKYPAVTRDLALVCDIDLYVSEIEKQIRQAAGDLLEDLTLFDVYMGNQIEKGKKSVAYSLTLRSRERTLTDTETDGVMEDILRSLAGAGIVLRG